MSARLARAALALALLATAIPGAHAAPAAPVRISLPLVAAPATDPDLAAITAAAACAAKAAPGEPLELGDVARTLAGPSRAQPWMSAEEQDAAARFAALRAEVAARLAGPISCRVGRVRVRVLILGVAPSGQVVGLRTVAVET